MKNLLNQIRVLEESLLKPHSRNDIDTLSTLLHDDFEEFGSSGRLCKKQEAIEWLVREDDNTVWSMTDFTVKLLSDDVALATYRAHKSDHTTSTNKHSMRVSIWQRVGNNWMLRFHQGTNIESV